MALRWMDFPYGGCSPTIRPSLDGSSFNEQGDHCRTAQSGKVVGEHPPVGPWWALLAFPPYDPMTRPFACLAPVRKSFAHQATFRLRVPSLLLGPWGPSREMSFFFSKDQDVVITRLLLFWSSGIRRTPMNSLVSSHWRKQDTMHDMRGRLAMI